MNIWANYEYCFFYALPNRYSTQSLEKWKRRRQLLIFSCLFKKLNCRIYTHMDLRSSGRFFSFAICSHLSLLVGQGHRLKQGQSWKEIVNKRKRKNREKEQIFRAVFNFWAAVCGCGQNWPSKIFLEGKPYHMQTFFLLNQKYEIFVDVSFQNQH